MRLWFFLKNCILCRSYRIRAIVIKLIYLAIIISSVVCECNFKFVKDCVDLSPIYAILIGSICTILVLCLTLSEDRKQKLKSKIIKVPYNGKKEKNAYEYLLFNLSFILVYLFIGLVFYIFVSFFEMPNYSLVLVATYIIVYAIFDFMNIISAIIFSEKN